ncbi:unnamed protein product, partial [Discosporangium mesarthrocarpum]
MTTIYSKMPMRHMVLHMIFLTVGFHRGLGDALMSESSTIEHGMIIDAGSTGSRIHVYQWSPRRFRTLPPPLSFPGTHNRWTERLKPGLSSFHDHLEDIPMALCPLIDFAKEVLAGKEENWHNYPIFLKATGGMRELPFETREKIMNAVRAYLSDSSSLPFAFSHDNARVISGEEEGAYGWAAVNFLKGNLVQESQGSGTVDAGFTVGTLDLGGASTQISFFKPDQDIVANLFKLQLGGQKHWNIYTHSFPHCGQNSARSRMQARLAGGPAMLVASTAPGQGVPDYGVRIEAEGSLASQGLGEKVAGAETGAEVWTGAGVRGKALAESMEAAGASGVEQNRRPMGVGPERLSGLLEVRDACLPLGYNETVTPPGGEGMLLMVPEAGGSNLSACMVQTHALLELHMNTWCEFSHSDQCSIMGTYQPDLPTGNDHGQFYAFAGYYYMWKFLQLPSRTVSIADIETAGRKVCAMSMSELEELNSQLDPATALDNVEHLPHYCFLTSYALSLLRDGYRFPEGAEITFVQEVAGYKVDWALGSMLYEINALPWQYIGPESNHGVNTTLDPGGNEHIAPGGCNGSADGVAVSDTAKTLRAGDASGDNDD